MAANSSREAGEVGIVVDSDLPPSRWSAFRSHVSSRAVILGLIFVGAAAGGLYAWRPSIFDSVRNLVPFTRTTAQREAIWEKTQPISDATLISDVKAINTSYLATKQAVGVSGAYTSQQWTDAYNSIFSLYTTCNALQKDVSTDLRSLNEAVPAAQNTGLERIFSSALAYAAKCVAEGQALNSIRAGRVITTDRQQQALIQQQQQINFGASIAAQQAQQQLQADDAQQAAWAAQHGLNAGLPPLP